MHLAGQRTLGIAILAVPASLVIVKRAAAGPLMRDSPPGGVRLWLVHVSGLFFLPVANPFTGVLLEMRRFEAFDPTHVTIAERPPLSALETPGGARYLADFAFRAWALTSPRGSCQAGGTAPRAADEMILRGPRGPVRHPMYAAALSIGPRLAVPRAVRHDCCPHLRPRGDEGPADPLRRGGTAAVVGRSVCRLRATRPSPDPLSPLTPGRR